MRKATLLYVWFSSFFIFSCASTSLETVKNDKYTNTKFKKIMIAYDTNDLINKKYTEHKFVELLGKKGVEAVAMIDVMPPIKQYVAKDLDNYLKKNNIDALLTVVMTSSYTDVSGGASYTYGTTYGGSYSGYTYGGVHTEPKTRHNVTLSEAKTGRIVWTATAFTEGNSSSGGSETMADSFASEVVNRMYKELYQ